MDDMNPFTDEQQIEELINFDHVAEDLAEMFEDLNEFNMNEYLNSNIDY